MAVEPIVGLVGILFIFLGATVAGRILAPYIFHAMNNILYKIEQNVPEKYLEELESKLKRRYTKSKRR